MKSFEDIPHRGGKVKFSKGEVGYELNCSGPASFYILYVSYNGVVLARKTNENVHIPQPNIPVFFISDTQGYFGHSCPSCTNYFRANGSIPELIICPYCLFVGECISYITVSQKQYICVYLEKYREHIEKQTDMALDLDIIISGLANNIITLDKFEESQQNILHCDTCRTNVDIIGKYASCPSCGKRNTLDIFKKDTERAKDQLKKGEITTNDALDRFVKHYSAFGKDIKHILQNNILLSAPYKNKLKNLDFQKIVLANDILKTIIGLSLFNDNELRSIKIMFGRRHLIAHCGGVVDQKYIVETGDKSVRLGQEILQDKGELLDFIQKLEDNTSDFYQKYMALVSEYLKAARCGLTLGKVYL